MNQRRADDDDWFDTLQEVEYEPCFWYETHRERCIRRCGSIMQEVEEIDLSGQSEDEKFRQKLELQEELDEVKVVERP
jgi:hypothetical protein